MNIDGATLVVAVLFVALLSAPFVLDRLNRRRKGE